MMVLAFILAGLVFFEVIQPWHIAVLALLLGIANAFDAPARTSFVVELVEREDLTNAIALNATMFNSANFIGPAVAGIVYAWAGPAWCFTLNGLSFLAVIAALALMRLQKAPKQVANGPALAQVTEGLRYVARDQVAAVLTRSISFVAVFGVALMNLLPAWSVNVLHGDVRTNGLLLSARGLGAMLGGLLLATLGRTRIKGKLWTLAAF
jgi:MFS family permease